MSARLLSRGLRHLEQYCPYTRGLVLILVYQFLLLPLDKISVKTMKICCQSELDGSKIEKIQDLGNFSHFWPFWAPLLGP